MAKLKWYGHDGANYQAKAVLAYLQAYDGIDESWNKEFKCYDADPKVCRWENGREQGYIVTLRSRIGAGGPSRQLNIAFFEHRNSDTICAVRWEQKSFNSICSIDLAEFPEGQYESKYDVSHQVSPGQAMEMADWIWKELVDFWVETDKFGE